MLLRRFLKKILAQPLSYDADVETLASKIYQQYFAARNVLQKNGSKEKPEKQKLFLEQLHAANLKPISWIKLNSHFSFNGLNLKVKKAELKKMGNHFLVSLPTFCEGDGWYRFFSGKFFFELKGPLARIYFNVTPNGAVFLLKYFSQLALQESISFGFKAATDLRHYDLRKDSAVFYYMRKDANIFEKQIKKLLSELSKTKKSLRPGIPPLTLKIKPGVCYAEDPKNNSMSFGIHRSRLLAKGLKHCQQGMSFEQHYKVISQVWKEEGFLPEKPWHTPT